MLVVGNLYITLMIAIRCLICSEVSDNCVRRTVPEALTLELEPSNIQKVNRFQPIISPEPADASG